MNIIDLRPDDASATRQVAQLLVEAFADSSPAAWPNLKTALEEVQASFGAGRISRIAIDEDSMVHGWIGGISAYAGHVWELHPLVVRVSQQGQGIGRALVHDLERRVQERGGLTITLGTDDENGQTSLAGIDLFPDVWQHIAQIKNLKRHPYEFYQKLGFVIVGVVPDANGLGKPDILMAKSLARRPVRDVGR